MDIVWAELAGGLPDPTQLVRVTLRLLTAMLVGAVVGLQRQQVGSPAGLRTHMLVAMGGALFVRALEVGMAWSEVSRDAGLTAGISSGRRHHRQVVGGVGPRADGGGCLWMTAAIGLPPDWAGARPCSEPSSPGSCSPSSATWNSGAL
jgi:putative Mg2+ transporter-C (MgtC) family protein